jgi:hypothetical protein
MEVHMKTERRALGTRRRISLHGVLVAVVLIFGGAAAHAAEDGDEPSKENKAKTNVHIVQKTEIAISGEDRKISKTVELQKGEEGLKLTCTYQMPEENNLKFLSGEGEFHGQTLSDDDVKEICVKLSGNRRIEHREPKAPQFERPLWRRTELTEAPPSAPKAQRILEMIREQLREAMR